MDRVYMIKIAKDGQSFTPSKWCIFDKTSGEYAHSVCGKIHNMRANDTALQFTVTDEETCGVCLAKAKDK